MRCAYIEREQRRRIRALSELDAGVRGVPAHERYEGLEREKAVGVDVSGYGGEADG